MQWSEKTAQSIMQRTPLLYEETCYNGKWSYDYGVILKGMQLLWQKTGKKIYADYIKRQLDAFVQADGTIKCYRVHNYNLDHINNGKLLFMLYQETGAAAYRKALDLLYSQLQTHPRTSEGAFWHKQVYPQQIWLDGLYMAAPFYAEYAKTFQLSHAYQDVLQQFSVSYDHLVDPMTGLLHHGWDETHQQLWADPATGQSEQFWSRAIGWYLMAVADTYELLAAVQDCQMLADILTTTLTALLTYQDSKGVWYQVTDQGGRAGNYLEASGSSMFVYAMAKGIRLGILDRRLWLPKLQRAHQGLLTEFVLVTKEGWVNLNKTCQGAGLGGPEKRDGSYAYYISEPIVCNDQKGLGAFLQALVEAEGV